MDITGTLAGYMPKVGGSSLFTFITWLLIGGVFLVIVGISAWVFVRWLKFNNKIIISEKINGRLEDTKRDSAMEMKVSKAGDTVFFLRKCKKYIPRPTLQSGRRVFRFWIREDGEWINYRFGDFDEQARALGAKFLDKEVRYARSQIQKGLKERYDKDSFWKTHGATILTFSFIALIAVMSWFLFDKWIEGLNAVPHILDRLSLLIDKVDNACMGGTGYASVG